MTIKGFRPQAKIEVPDAPDRARRPFFNRATGRAFEVQAAEDVTEIDLYDEIGFWGVTASAFRRRLNAIKTSQIRLRINSPGGDVFDGIAMHNDLQAHPAEVRVEVAGIAASAASIVAMAGDEISIADNAFLMIHNAWGVVMGDRNDFLDVADLLTEIDAALARTYAARTGLDVAEISDMMDAETWLSGEAAVDRGFADEVTGSADVEARFDLSSFKNVPRAVPGLTAKKGQPPVTPRDLERALRDAGYSRSAARAVVRTAIPGAADDLCDAGSSEAFIASLQRLHRTIEERTAR